MSDCWFEYDYRWPQFGDDLVSGDTGKIREALMLLEERDRLLEDHLRNPCGGGCESSIFGGRVTARWTSLGGVSYEGFAVMALTLPAGTTEVHVTGVFVSPTNQTGGESMSVQPAVEQTSWTYLAQHPGITMPYPDHGSITYVIDDVAVIIADVVGVGFYMNADCAAGVPSLAVSVSVITSTCGDGHNTTSGG